jgi:hypothetical protein
MEGIHEKELPEGANTMAPGGFLRPFGAFLLFANEIFLGLTNF